MSKRITIIVSDIDKAISLEWLVKYIDANIFSLSFIVINNHSNRTPLIDFLESNEIEYKQILHTTKLRLFQSIFRCITILMDLKPDAIHCHLLDANLIGLTAGRLLRIKKRIYSRHDSTIHHEYHRKGILYDRLNNWNATHIIAVSKNVYQVLVDMEGVSSKKISLIHYGFDLDEFHNHEVSQEFIKKHNPNNQHPVIGVISRFVKWKGIQYIIPAFERVLVNYPDALLVLANAKGPYEKELLNLLKNIPQKNYVLIPFENDIFSLYKLFDIFIHAPVNKKIEAFGQVYVEALAAKVPSIFTLSGIASELIIENENALIVNYKDSKGIYCKIMELLDNQRLQKTLINNGIKSLNGKFEIEKMIKGFERIYSLK